MKDLADALTMIKGYEGCVPYMYLDSRGYVTVGVGFLLASAADAIHYAFYKNNSIAASSQKATPSETAAEWTNIKGQAIGHLDGYYKQFTTMQMMPNDIDAVLATKVNSFEIIARHTFGDWDNFPSPAQLALLDMIYNLGSLTAFPHLVAAANGKDWAKCAAQCYRLGPGEQRNSETKARFEQAAKEQPLPAAQRAAMAPAQAAHS